MYRVKEEAGGMVTENFILTQVVPAVGKVFEAGVGLVLGRALLWAAVGFPDCVPASLRARVVTALERVGGDGPA